MRLMFLIVLFIFTLFAAQLLRIQGLDASSLASKALGSRLTTQTIPAVRGQIQDSDGSPLAISVDRRNVTVDQTEVPGYATGTGAAKTIVGTSGAAKALAPLLHLPVATVQGKLTGTRRFAYVAKSITPQTWDQIDALSIPGIYDEQTTQRLYPAGPLAASLIGFVQPNPKQPTAVTPLGGLELGLNAQLAGTPGWIRFERSATGSMIPTGEIDQVKAVPGRSVRLTIDQDLQWKAETLLADEVKKTGALSGTAVVLDVATGKLLAVATAPTFDPTDFGHATPTSLVDQAFAGIYEPGSTSKVMTIAAAMQQGLVTPTTGVTVPGTLHRADRTFHDAEAHGTEKLTVAGVLAKSSNIGAIEVGEQMTPATMYDYLSKFGVGQPTGVNFPGESAGILAQPQDWNGSQRYTVLFGQGLSVNAVQAAGIFQTIANNGLRMPPSLIDGYVDAAGTVTPVAPTTGVRVVSPQVATAMRRMLEGVVSTEGTAPAAQIPGYRVAGKTGTAQRFDATCKCYRGFTASFIGMAPADAPKLVVAVTLQRPVNGYYGGSVAAPVFQKIMSYALARLDIPPTGSKSPKVRVYAK